MFDIGFSEIMVIAVVALIVIGPERLPKVARTLGHLFGRMQRYVNDVKADISREMQFEELRKLQSEMEQAAQSIEQSVSKEMHEAQEAFDKISQETAVDAAATPPALAAATPGHETAVEHEAPGHAAAEAHPASGGEQLSLDLGAPPSAEHRSA